MSNTNLFEIIVMITLGCTGVLFFYGAIKDARESMRKLHEHEEAKEKYKKFMNIKVHDKGPFIRS